MLSLLPATLMGYIGAVKAGYIILLYLIFLINYRGWVIKVCRIIIIINFVQYINKYM